MINTFCASLFSNILKFFFTKGVTALWENKDNVKAYLKTLFLPKYKNARIRFSISYLFRIRIPETNYYLLVMNRRIKNQLQPVGGCYKRYGDDKLFESWDFALDNKSNGLGTDRESEHDLRFTVKGKHLIKVIKWFDEGKEREVCANREFKEELVYTEILDKEVFRDIKYKHIKRVSKYLHWSPFHKCYEVLIYDIMELLPSEPQKIALVNLEKNNSIAIENGYAIVSCDDIQQLRLVIDGHQIARIGEHTKLIINQNF